MGAVAFALGSWGAVVSLISLAARAGSAPLGRTLSWRGAELLARSAAVDTFVAGAHQRKTTTGIAWSLSFYTLPFGLGWGLLALGNWLVSVD